MTMEMIELIGKTQYQIAEIVFGGFKTKISFTNLEAAKQYIGVHYKHYEIQNTK